MLPIRRAGVAARAALSLLLIGNGIAGCAQREPPAPRLTLLPARFEQLVGWEDDRLSAAVPAMLRSCAAILRKADDAPLDRKTESEDFGPVGEWRRFCAGLVAVPPGDDGAVRRLFEKLFAPLLAGNNGDETGLFTGYFETTLHGSRKRGGRFQVPLYRPPPKPVRTAYSRAEIEDGALAGRGLELCWVDDPIGAFFLEIQGSGRVELREGGTLHLGYAGQNGRRYVPVGRLLVQRGEMPLAEATMAAIRGWMTAHPKAGAALRRENPSYVFFREIPADGPLGAENVVLTAGRSLAIDRRFIPLGLPIWVEARERFHRGVIRRLVVAQDTGGAIKGPVRGDLFWGHGKEAAAGAGAMNAHGRYYLLVPKKVAARLGTIGH